MKKYASKLLFVAAGLFYLSAFLLSSSSSTYVALGTMFLVLGMVNNFHSKPNHE